MTDLHRIALRVDPRSVESTVAVLLELVPSGLELVEGHEDVELAVYGDAQQEGRVRAVFPEAISTVVAAGWEDGWRDFHRPVRAGGLWIGPPWIASPPGAPAVVIDPGRAFGTGAHPTTRLCVELLSSLERGSLLDVGCGSGVLSIAAARLGFAPVAAVDDDPVAVAATRENARVNGVHVDARLLDATADVLPGANVAVANVLLRPVEVILARLDAELAVTSGYRAGERPAHSGWSHLRTAALDGWAADVFGRESAG